MARKTNEDPRELIARLEVESGIKTPAHWQPSSRLWALGVGTVRGEPMSQREVDAIEQDLAAFRRVRDNGGLLCWIPTPDVEAEVKRHWRQDPDAVLLVTTAGVSVVEVDEAA